MSQLVANPKRAFGPAPIIKLGDTFKKVSNFQKRISSVPNMLELDHLTVSGDVWFGKKVKLSGSPSLFSFHICQTYLW